MCTGRLALEYWVLHISKQDGAAYRDVKDRIMLRNGAESPVAVSAALAAWMDGYISFNPVLASTFTNFTVI
jgi:hypothetical protein